MSLFSSPAPAYGFDGANMIGAHGQGVAVVGVVVSVFCAKPLSVGAAPNRIQKDVLSRWRDPSRCLAGESSTPASSPYWKSWPRSVERRRACPGNLQRSRPAGPIPEFLNSIGNLPRTKTWSQNIFEVNEPRRLASERRQSRVCALWRSAENCLDWSALAEPSESRGSVL
jgi:hypothetical protein